MCYPNRDHLHVFIDQYCDKGRTELQHLWTSLPAGNRYILIIAIQRRCSFLGWLIRRSSSWNPTQAGILQGETAAVLGDGLVTVPLTLFWADHFQVSYTLWCPVPTFTSQFLGKVYEAPILSQTISPQTVLSSLNLRPLMPPQTGSAHAGSQTNLWII